MELDRIIWRKRKKAGVKGSLKAARCASCTLQRLADVVGQKGRNDAEGFHCRLQVPRSPFLETRALWMGTAGWASSGIALQAGQDCLALTVKRGTHHTRPANPLRRQRWRVPWMRMDAASLAASKRENDAGKGKTQQWRWLSAWQKTQVKKRRRATDRGESGRQSAIVTCSPGLRRPCMERAHTPQLVCRFSPKEWRVLRRGCCTPLSRAKTISTTGRAQSEQPTTHHQSNHIHRTHLWQYE